MSYVALHFFTSVNQQESVGDVSVINHVVMALINKAT